MDETGRWKFVPRPRLSGALRATGNDPLLLPTFSTDSLPLMNLAFIEAYRSGTGNEFFERILGRVRLRKGNDRSSRHTLQRAKAVALHDGSFDGIAFSPVRSWGANSLPERLGPARSPSGVAPPCGPM
jgi:hypothetical protein